MEGEKKAMDFYIFWPGFSESTFSHLDGRKRRPATKSTGPFPREKTKIGKPLGLRIPVWPPSFGLPRDLTRHCPHSGFRQMLFPNIFQLAFVLIWFLTAWYLFLFNHFTTFYTNKTSTVKFNRFQVLAQTFRTGRVWSRAIWFLSRVRVCACVPMSFRNVFYFFFPARLRAVVVSRSRNGGQIGCRPFDVTVSNRRSARCYCTLACWRGHLHKHVRGILCPSNLLLAGYSILFSPSARRWNEFWGFF